MGNHWYNTLGNPVHKIMGANGKERDRTLRDARKTGDANSVTGFLDILDKPQLVVWSNNQILDAAIKFKPSTLVGVSEEVTTAWKRQVLEESKKIGKDAADTGRKIHRALEEAITLNLKAIEYEEYVAPVIQLLFDRFGETDWITEKSFYHPSGFGGTIDLHSPSKKIVIDFKTKKDKAFVKKKDGTYEKMGYDNHMMQVAAYGAGLGFDRSFDDFLEQDVHHSLKGEYYNLFISTETPGLIHLEEWDLVTINRGWKMFLHLVDFWKLSKEYDPASVIIT